VSVKHAKKYKYQIHWVKMGSGVLLHNLMVDL